MLFFFIKFTISFAFTFQKFLFATEQLDGHLRIYDKNTGKGYINYQLGYIPYDVLMYDESSQPGNSCKLINKEIELNRIVSLCYHYAIRVPKNKTKSLGNPLPPKRSVALC